MVGSSRKRMEGEEMSAHAMLRRRFSPPDRPRTRMPPGSAPPTWDQNRLQARLGFCQGFR